VTRRESDYAPSKTLRFLKVPNYHLPKISSEESEETNPGYSKGSLQALADVSGFNIVAVPGPSPSFLIKTSSSHPRVVNLRSKPVLGMSGYNTSSCPKGFAFVDSSVRPLLSESKSGDKADLY
jgi:cleavage and polyadenylation specificity factor subunit 1